MEKWGDNQVFWILCVSELKRNCKLEAPIGTSSWGVIRYYPGTLGDLTPEESYIYRK
jgi:hypothetical protein